MRPKPGANWPGSVLTHNYEGSTFGRRTLDWTPGNDSVNTALFGSSDILRARSRDLIRKNAWASSGSETFASEVVGTGIKPQSKHPTQATKLQLQKLWLKWTDYCDAHGTLDFYGLQALILRSAVEGGECFVRIRRRKPQDNLQIPLQIQALEAEHCPTWKNETLDNGNVIKQGIEFDQIGRRVAYWLYPVHPGERGVFGLFIDEQLQPVRVTADQILHIYRPVRVGQIRGEPWLSRALVRLYDIDQYTDAELARKKTAALFAGFVTELDPADPLPGNVSDTLPGDPGAYGAPPGIQFAGLEPGTLQRLNPGEDIKFSQPADVGAGFEPFLRSQLREVAASMNISYEQLTGDLSGVNYSSIRAGLLKVRRWMEQIQHSIVVHQLCRPLWQQVVEAAVFAGEISARDYRRNQEQYLDVKWIPDGWKSIDAQKDLEADKGSVRSGFKSQAQVISERGYDIEEVYAEIAAGNDLADGLGLILDSDPRQTSNTGLRPAGRDPANPDGLQNPETVPDPSTLDQSTKDNLVN